MRAARFESGQIAPIRASRFRLELSVRPAQLAPAARKGPRPCSLRTARSQNSTIRRSQRSSSMFAEDNPFTKRKQAAPVRGYCPQLGFGTPLASALATGQGSGESALATRSRRGRRVRGRPSEEPCLPWASRQSAPRSLASGLQRWLHSAMPSAPP